MIQNIADWMKRYERYFLVILIFVFLLIRVPGLSEPLHQDEYKWPLIVNPTNSGGAIPHPPLSEYIYKTAGGIVGYDIHFRYIPLLFATLNLILLYFILKKRFGIKVASVGAVLFAISYFSILASLMVDTDGAIMPFFFLLAFLAYDRIEKEPSVTRNMWILILFISAIAGLFVKVSFVLALGALGADFLWHRRGSLNIILIFRYIGYTIAFVVGVIVLLFISQKIFPFFSLSSSVKYWEHFAVGNRNWFQTFIQFAKAILYTSPLLILTPFFLPKSNLKETVPFLAYILFGFIFYILLFDFSLGALDRYLQFIVIPLCALSAIAIVETMKVPESISKVWKYVCGGIILSLLIFILQIMHQAVPPLYPKTEWVSRILSLHWNFLYPFSGGSGPIGFYISFIFMGLIWITSLLLIGIGFFQKQYRKNILLVLIPIGILYNGVFAEEYLFGKINGSSSRLVLKSVQFIENNKDISKVIVYNDNGGAEVQAIGKYERRMYTAPQFESTYRDILPKFTGHILFIDIPRVDSESYYGKYMSSCRTIYSDTDRYITARVLDCSHKSL